MKRLIVLAVIAAGCGASGGKKSAVMHRPVELPVKVVEDRFFLATKTVAGAPVVLAVASASGMALTRQAVERLKLPVAHDGPQETVEFPRFYDARLPRPLVEAVQVLAADAAPRDGSDGVLGAKWFAGRVFTFDYAARRLLFRAPGDLPDVAAEHRLATPSERFRIEIDGAPLDMALDTGATVVLSDAAKQQLGGAATERATSFVADSVFARWRAAHPEWRVIDGADAGGAPMIEVPRVRLAGHEIGPVWFTRRPDGADGLAGALGGSALHHFQRVTVDWANAVALFE